MPKGEGTQRPLGRPAGEDHRLPRAVARLLEAIYAQDVLRGSDGYRPHGGALAAGDTRTITLQCGRYAWGVEADITQCFDTIDHDGRVRMVAERIEDGALRRVVQKWRKAGGLDTDGQGRHPGSGPPQGGTVSPSLANGLLPSVLDLWVEKVVKQPCRGAACLIRYAEDCGCAFAVQAEAERFSQVRGQRLEKFGRTLSAAKTRLIPFNRSRAAGNTSCEFRGCACRWERERKGHEHLQRRPARTKLRPSRHRCTAGCKAHRHLRLPGRFPRLNAKLRGDDKYYGVHGNAASLKECFNTARRMLLKWLNRRSQRHRNTWQGDTAVRERFHGARPRIVGRPKTRQAALKAEADLRKRVLLKSPVRENRTPGSGRGRSGNWPSYRDDVPGRESAILPWILISGGTIMRTYRALLHGDRLEWLEDAPESQTDAPLRVHVTVVEQAPPAEVHARGHAMAAILEQLAERRTFSAITDPIRWQRELRQERGLPGREG